MRTKDQHPEGDGLVQPRRRTSVPEGGHLYKPLRKGSGKNSESRGDQEAAAERPDEGLQGQLAGSREQWSALCP